MFGGTTVIECFIFIFILYMSYLQLHIQNLFFLYFHILYSGFVGNWFLSLSLALAHQQREEWHYILEQERGTWIKSLLNVIVRCHGSECIKITQLKNTHCFLQAFKWQMHVSHCFLPRHILSSPRHIPT